MLGNVASYLWIVTVLAEKPVRLFSASEAEVVFEECSMNPMSPRASYHNRASTHFTKLVSLSLGGGFCEVRTECVHVRSSAVPFNAPR